MDPSRSKTVESVQQLPILQIPGEPPASVPGEVPYLTDNEQRDAALQVQWSNWMSDVQKNNSVYKHVSVLLLSWDPECDDMSVANEVQRLAEIFEQIYHYQVSNIHIDSRKKSQPQAQVNAAVANFVHDNDEPNSLFIVYYAGHGSPGKNPGELKISGRRKQLKPNEWNHITWNLTESNLRATQSDVLLIFDCCHANDLGRDTTSLNSTCFEYLAASTSPYTRSPGPTSFTSALIWALKELAGQGQQSPSAPSAMVPMFTTSKLAAEICKAPGFPKDQKPSLTTRDIDAYQRIVLAPLPLQGAAPPVLHEDDEDDIRPTPECLDLTFFFTQQQDETELKKLADHLIRFMKLNGTSLRKIQWGGIKQWGAIKPPQRRFQAVVHKIIERQRSASNIPHSYPGAGGLSPHVAPATSSGMFTPTSPTESTTLLPNFPKQNPTAESCKRGPGVRLRAFFRKFRWPKIEIEEPVVVPQQNDDASPHVKSGRSFISRIRKVLKGFRSVLSGRP